MPLFLHWGESASNSILHSLVDALQTISLGTSIPETVEAGVLIIDGKAMKSFADTFGQSRFYATYVIVQYALGLILCGVAVLKTISSGLQRQWLRFLCVRPVFYLSHLSEETLLLAKSIEKEARSQKKRIAICFASASEETISSLAQSWNAAGLKNAICFNDNINGSILPKMASSINYILFSADENESIDCLNGLLKEHEKKHLRNPHIKYFIVAHSRNAERIIDGISNLYKNTDQNQMICLINPVHNLVMNILNQYPLYQSVPTKDKENTEPTGIASDSSPFEDKEKKELNIVIAGASPLAEQFLRNAYACGQMANQNLSITLVDPEAERLKKELLCSCPVLKNGPIELLEACGDLCFEEISVPAEVADIKYVGKANYILLAFEDDAENIQAARRIRRIIEQQKLTDESRREVPVQIIYSVKNRTLSEICKTTNGETVTELYTPCTMIPVGNLEQMYSVDMFFYHELLVKAFLLDCAYAKNFPGDDKRKENSKADADTNIEANQDVDVKINIPELKAQYVAFLRGIRYGASIDNADKCSSLAAALHSNYYDEAMGEEKPANERIKDLLAHTEHRRWVAYMIMSGQQPPTSEQLDSYFFTEKYSHKNAALYLHPCMRVSATGTAANLWTDEEVADGLDMLSRTNHAKVVAELKKLLEGTSECAMLDGLTPNQKERIEEAAEKLLDQAKGKKAMRLAKALFTDYKAFDGYIVGRTKDILKLAGNKELSDALRLFWLEV